MELDIFVVQEKVINKSLEVYHVPAQDEWVDGLTKALSPNIFTALRYKLSVFDKIALSHPPSLRGEYWRMCLYCIALLLYCYSAWALVWALCVSIPLTATRAES